ncbi:ABC transporter permease [Allobacillus halotolerans]|uniref:ABC transporter permease n=1 Tax=Allobacillus halotolerans TaxID=570278 RepID=A0ABS6GNP3_9BACI|nr:ABC transporter permease [Allobacillus halotolerans]MBU6080727.1 ABC transporter permease [Allobacillus halotolerans]
MLLYHLWINEWKRLWKSPALLLVTLLLPVALLIVVGFVVYSSVQEDLEEVEMVIIDEDETFETKALINQLAGDQTLAEQIHFIDGGTNLQEHIQNPKEAAAIIQIPEGFTEQLRSGENENITIYLNDQVPFSSQLAQLFLESGQSYITSAQAGVNTVHHFYSSDLEGEERSDVLQQNTIHFTFLALGRNDLFDMREGASSGLLSWNHQAVLTGILIVYFLTYILLASLFQPKENHAIQERLQLISVTKSKQRLATFLFHVSFSWIYLCMLIWIVSSQFEAYLSFSWLYILQWFSLAVIFAGLFMVTSRLIKERASMWFVFILISIAFLFVNGFIIPPAYLPEFLQATWLMPLRSLYTGFVSILAHNQWPWVEWVFILVGIGIILLLNGLPREKVQR